MPLSSTFSNYRLWIIATIVVLMSVLLLRGIDNPDLQYPDADRILMDGVFILDLLQDLPVPDIYGYAERYYAQYPALSIGYRPPFLPMVEAVFNGIFGINIWSSRLAILLFAIAGITSWFLMLERLYSTATAAVATVLLVTNQFVAQWGWYTMAELPVMAMSMLVIASCYRYIESGASRWLYVTALLFSLAVWTKVTAIYLLPVIIAYIGVSGRLRQALHNKHAYLATALMMIMVIPLGLVMISLGDQNIAQSVAHWQPAVSQAAGTMTEASAPVKPIFNLLDGLNHLYTLHFTSPVLILAGAGVLGAIWYRDKRVSILAILILCTYVFFSALGARDPRYFIFWVPPLTAFAALPFYYSSNWPKLQKVLLASALLVSAYQVNLLYSRGQQFASGYQAAAKYILAHSKSPMVFFDGYRDGYFTYFMRANDEERSMYVLRGDKLLTSSSITIQNRLEIHAHHISDINDLFTQYGVEYAVVEVPDPFEIEIHQILRDYLKSEAFVLEESFDIKSSSSILNGRQLLVYRRLDWEPLKASSIKLRLPVVGKTITVKFGDSIRSARAKPTSPTY
ncbi:MAG: glycosyltransferase family 39 protein [Porticoccus sp.]|nr:glycosyltransferase family 39 protein [Porticoccus sp.]